MIASCAWMIDLIDSFVLGAGAAAAGLLAITPGSRHMVRQVFGQVIPEHPANQLLIRRSFNWSFVIFLILEWFTSS